MTGQKKDTSGDNWLGVTDSSSQNLAFTTGNAAMTIGGSWDAATISMNNPGLNYGAFAIPAEDGTTGLVGTASNGFSVNSASENLDAALAFANYCATKDAQTVWVQSAGAYPVLMRSRHLLRSPRKFLRVVRETYTEAGRMYSAVILRQERHLMYGLRIFRRSLPMR